MSDTQLVVVGNKVGVIDPNLFPNREAFDNTIFLLENYTNAPVIPADDVRPGTIREDQRVDVGGINAAGEFLRVFANELGLDPSDASAIARDLSAYERGVADDRIASAARAAEAAFQAQRDALIRERDDTIREMVRASEDRQLKSDLASLYDRGQEAQRDAETTIARLALQQQNTASEAALVEGQLTRTLEALGIQDTAARRQFGVDTFGTQGRLNTLAGVGSPITNLAQRLAQDREDERQRLVQIEEDERTAVAENRRRQLANQSNDIYFRQEAARQDAEAAFLATIRAAQDRQSTLDESRLIDDYGRSIDEQLDALANTYRNAASKVGGGETVRTQIDPNQVQAQYELPDLYNNPGWNGGGVIYG